MAFHEARTAPSADMTRQRAEPPPRLRKINTGLTAPVFTDDRPETMQCIEFIRNVWTDILAGCCAVRYKD